MGDAPNPTATPPATSGGLTKEDVAALFTEALKPFATVITQLTEGQKALQEAAKTATSGLKADDVAKLVATQLAAHQEAQAASTAKSQAKSALREKVIAAKLPGVPKGVLASLPDTEDEAVLTAAAEALRKDLEGLPGVKLADIGGAAKDGGTTPAKETPKAIGANSGLASGTAKFASEIKLPA